MSKYLQLWEAKKITPREGSIKAALAKREYQVLSKQTDRNRLDKAMNFLLSSDLLSALVKESQNRIAGEEATIESLHVWLAGRLVKNPLQLASYNLLVNSESGAGKDYVAKAVLKDYPEPSVIMKTKITPEVFTYWHTEKEWTWDGKVFYLEDVSTPILNSSVFKVMASGGSKATVIDKQRARDINIKGKPVMIITTATARPNKELSRRFPIISLDETHGQTRAIIDRQAKAAADGTMPEHNLIIREALSLLRQVNVKVVVAEEIAKYLPDKHLGIRTHAPRFFDLIKASAALHQFQRERDQKGYVLATWEDYDIARQCILRTVSSSNLVSLTRNQRKIIEIFEGSKDIKWWTLDTLTPKVLFISERQLRRELKKLAGDGFLVAQLGESSGPGRRPLEYCKAETYGLLLPSAEEIMAEMSTMTEMSINQELKEFGENRINDINDINDMDFNDKTSKNAHNVELKVTYEDIDTNTNETTKKRCYDGL